MTYVVGLVSLLVALAAIIAYAGDRLGTWVGRKRLTLFGARPRLTGQIVGVVVGILIMLTTLGVLALAFQNATQTLVNAQRAADELRRLQVQERVLSGQLAGLEADLAEARATIASAEAEREEALRERDVAEAERDQIRADRDELLIEIDATQAALADLSGRLETADVELQAVEAELAQAEIDRDAALAEADDARAEAATAREEAARLEEQVAAVADQLAAANVGLLELEVQVSEAEANVAVAVERLQQAELAVVEVEAARDAALAERDAATLERDAAQAEADELRATTAGLRGQLQELVDEVATLETTAARLDAEAEALQRENQGLQARNDQLAAGNAELLEANAALQELEASLREQINEGNRALLGLEQQVVQLTDRLEEEARKLSEVSQEFSRVASGEVTFERDQVIFSGAIYANEVVAVREELADFVRRASAATASRGAGEVVLTSEQFNSLVEVITETEASDLVRLISPRNQFSPTQVEVVVEALENTRIFERGRLLVARQIHLGSSELPTTQEEIRAAIAQVKAEAVRVVRRAGLDELQAPEYVGVSDESFMNQLLRLSGPVVIGVATVEAVDRAGPARVELVIVY